MLAGERGGRRARVHKAEDLPRVASAIENVSFSKNDPGPLVTRRPVFTIRREQRL